MKNHIYHDTVIIFTICTVQHMVLFFLFFDHSSFLLVISSCNKMKFQQQPIFEFARTCITVID